MLPSMFVVMVSFLGRIAVVGTDVLQMLANKYLAALSPLMITDACGLSDKVEFLCCNFL